MPSVRVRRSYSTLGDSPAEQHRQLSHLFSQNAGPVEETAGPSQDGNPILPESLAHPRLRLKNRVENHVLHRPSLAHISQASAVGEAGNRSQDGMVTYPGQEADVQIYGDGDGQPGRIGSALSLPTQGTAEQDPFRNENHHTDDVVEHLDVIDPQVATVSTLTNAANTLVFPPMSFYSRKPVVVLSAPPPNKRDAEAASQYEDQLDRHVDDVLQRRAKIKRTLNGLWSFLKTPMGVVTAVYGFCVVFWGAAIVLFLGKLINLHNADLQGFWVEISSQVVNGLFTVTGIGFIPFRTLDTYRVYKIWNYKRRTRKLRRRADLPPLLDEDDLPDPIYDPNYVHVLTDEEQNDLHRQQRKFHHSQSWYRPHGTETHRAFPINYALVICLLNDGNSFFQIILCACMWSMNRFIRPPWTTGTLIPASFLCGIFSAVVIWKGGQKTRRTQEVEERLRAALAQHDTPAKQAPPSENHENGASLQQNTLSKPDIERRATVEEKMIVPAPPAIVLEPVNEKD